jgi:Protein of unknown function (DUF1064)
MSTRGWENVKAIVSPAKPPRPRVQRPVVTRSKYRAIRTEVNGFTFDSRAEARRYQELLALGALGEIRNLELQPKFPIVIRQGFFDIPIATYVADFRYEERKPRDPADWCDVWCDRIEDVKGMPTPVYRLKKKLVEALHAVKIREIR